MGWFSDNGKVAVAARIDELMQTIQNADALTFDVVQAFYILGHIEAGVQFRNPPPPIEFMGLVTIWQEAQAHRLTEETR